MPPVPRCIIIAGPNGAGKTTFAKRFLRGQIGLPDFINADTIAAGLSLDPQSVAVAAGRLFLSELDRLVEARASFAFETTLSGLSHLSRLRRMKEAGYVIEIVYLRIHSAGQSLRRVAIRVRQGGHNIPREDIFRAKIYCGDSIGAGKTLTSTIKRLLTNGAYTKTPAKIRY